MGLVLEAGLHSGGITEVKVIETAKIVMVNRQSSLTILLYLC